MMKKIILGCVALLGIAQMGNAQEPIQNKRVHFGIFVAPTVSWMKATTSSSDDKLFKTNSQGSKLGFTYGLMADIYFAENYALSTGLQINMTGGKLLTENANSSNTTNTVKDADFNYKLNFVEVPVNIKLRSDEFIPNLRAFGQLGVTVGVNIAKKADYTVNYYNEISELNSVKGENEKIKGTLAIPFVMAQMNIGGGVEYKLTEKVSGYAGIFFNNGFAPDATNPNKYNLGNNLPTFKDGNTRLNNFSLKIGFFF